MSTQDDSTSAETPQHEKTDAVRVGSREMVRTFSDPQQNALMTALLRAAEVNENVDLMTGEINVYGYLETTPKASLIVELVDELNRLGWRISPNNSDEPTPTGTTARDGNNHPKDTK